MIKRRIRTTVSNKRGNARPWKDRMKGVPCYIVGNGPSLSKQPVRLLEPYFTIGINKAHMLIDPTILMWQDIEFWYSDRKAIAKTECIKYCRNYADPDNRFFNFKLKSGKFKLPHNPLELFGMGASGPLAFELAYVLGCDPIVLIGMDCCYRDGKTDFYGTNPHHKAHTLKNCTKGLEWIHGLKDFPHYDGRRVISCSDNEIFPQENLTDVIKELQPLYEITGREDLTKRLLNL